MPMQTTRPGWPEAPAIIERMSRRRAGAWTLAALLGAGLAPRPSAAQGGARQEARSAAFRAMRAIAEGVKVEAEAPGTDPKPGLAEAPIYRFDDPTRDYSDGTVWAWGRSGRPAALLTIAPEHNATEHRWLCELTALAERPFSAAVPGASRWSPPAGAGIALAPIPRAPAPAGDDPGRLRQLKELSRRFKAFERFSPDEATAPERYELRLLTRPIARYADPKAHVLDGAIFFFVYGTNPEIALLIEARDDGSSKPAWAFGAARIAGAELHLGLGDQVVWTRPRHYFPTPREPYWVFTRPIIEAGPR